MASLSSKLYASLMAAAAVATIAGYLDSQRQAAKAPPTTPIAAPIVMTPAVAPVPSAEVPRPKLDVSPTFAAAAPASKDDHRPVLDPSLLPDELPDYERPHGHAASSLDADKPRKLIILP